jgi:hypothetical protein
MRVDKTSLIFLFFKDEKTAGLSEKLRLFARSADEYEVIIINDGSRIDPETLQMNCLGNILVFMLSITKQILVMAGQFVLACRHVVSTISA